MFSLLELSTRSTPLLLRHSLLLLGEVVSICTLEWPACRHGPGMAQTHSSD